MQQVFFAYELFPRYVGYSRGVPEYYPKGNETIFEPIGLIPQVAHTYAYFEETYGVINEKQVAISESTCSGVFGTSPAGQGGKAIMSIDTLSQLAMERSASAREAVALMGAMAEKYGFYGAGSFEGTAESLLVSDPKEGWVFHVLPDPTGTSAIWAAQRVPAGHVTVVPNIFVIRDVDLQDTGNFLGSANMYTVAEEKGWWTPGSLLDFTATYSDGEYAHKFYSGRRLWRAFDMLAPSLKLSPDYDNLRSYT
jgi:dipeptidase